MCVCACVCVGGGYHVLRLVDDFWRYRPRIKLRPPSIGRVEPCFMSVEIERLRKHATHRKLHMSA